MSAHDPYAVQAGLYASPEWVAEQRSTEAPQPTPRRAGKASTRLHALVEQHLDDVFAEQRAIAERDPADPWPAL